jgi:molybdopterin converting factor small subunit
MEQKIRVPAEKKKRLAQLSTKLGELGFSRITYTKDRLVIERISGEDLKGKPNLDYRITFLDGSIELLYQVAMRESERARLLEILPLFLDVLVVAEDYYDIKASAVFTHVLKLLADLRKVTGKDILELSAEFEDLRSKYDSLNSRYRDLVGSSEDNAKILLECERRRDELMKVVKKLKALSDERLREELYVWLKMHNGHIEINEFGKVYDVSPARVEEGLDMLIRGGYIKRRID